MIGWRAWNYGRHLPVDYVGNAGRSEFSRERNAQAGNHALSGAFSVASHDVEIILNAQRDPEFERTRIIAI